LRKGHDLTQDDQVGEKTWDSHGLLRTIRIFRNFFNSSEFNVLVAKRSHFQAGNDEVHRAVALALGTRHPVTNSGAWAEGLERTRRTRCVGPAGRFFPADRNPPFIQVGILRFDTLSAFMNKREAFF
jgi:hypothetical protein